MERRAGNRTDSDVKMLLLEEQSPDVLGESSGVGCADRREDLAEVVDRDV
jgi:hypothetical protein